LLPLLFMQLSVAMEREQTVLSPIAGGLWSIRPDH
jgi:hypothetical protein